MLANRIWQAIKSIIYDRTTPVTVVSSAYTTSSTARQVRLSNGWLVDAVIDGSVNLKLYVSKDGGATWLYLGYSNNAVSNSSFSMCSYGTKVYFIIVNPSATSFSSQWVDVATHTLGNQIFNFGTIDTSQTSFGTGCSIAVNSIGTAWTLTWSSKNATYTNSFNIRSVKTTDFVSFTKQDGSAGIDQITSFNTSGSDMTNSYIQYDRNNSPVVFYQYVVSSTYIIRTTTYSAGVWQAVNIYNGGSYSQSNPTATLLTGGTNAGRIVCKWQGLDSTDTTKQNQRIAYSDTDGSVWTVVGKITTGNSVDRKDGNITSDKNGNVYAVYDDNGTTSYQISTNGGTTFGTLTTIGTGTLPSACDNYKDFANPLTIFKTVSAVQFYGKWTETP